MLTSAEGEFWSKKTSTRSGIDVRCPNSMYNESSIFTVNDSKLHKVVSLTLNKSGTKERTYAIKDDGELGSIVIYLWRNI